MGIRKEEVASVLEREEVSLLLEDEGIGGETRGRAKRMFGPLAGQHS